MIQKERTVAVQGSDIITTDKTSSFDGNTHYIKYFVRYFSIFAVIYFSLRVKWFYKNSSKILGGDVKTNI